MLNYLPPRPLASTPTATPTATGQPPTPTATGQPPTSTPSGTTTYALDTYTRNITDGWGSAEIGGSYTLYGTAANFDVNGTAGTLTMPSVNISRSAVLRGVSALDVNMIVRLKTDKLASGSHYGAYMIARSVSSNTEYVGHIQITPSRTVHLRAVRFVNGTSTLLGTQVAVTGLTHAANSYIVVRGQVVGTNPTTIRLKAWADGQAEPANWQYTVTDSTASLQVAGAVGLRAFLPSAVTNAPIVFTFDDFSVTSP